MVPDGSVCLVCCWWPNSYKIKSPTTPLLHPLSHLLLQCHVSITMQNFPTLPLSDMMLTTPSPHFPKLLAVMTTHFYTRSLPTIWYITRTLTSILSFSTIAPSLCIVLVQYKWIIVATSLMVQKDDIIKVLRMYLLFPSELSSF